MNIQESWEKALKTTEIVRPRVQGLHTFEATQIPYIFLAESQVNRGDTMVRKGSIMVEKPSIILPFNLPQFEGFNFEEDLHVGDDFVPTFLMVRGIQFPSLRYNNKTDRLEVFEGSLNKALEHHRALLQRDEDVHTGLVTGKADCWQFSVLIFVCTQVARGAEGDFKKLLEDYRKKGWVL